MGEGLPPPAPANPAGACTPCSGSLQSLPNADRCTERPASTTNLVVVIAVVAASIGISLALVAWVLLQLPGECGATGWVFLGVGAATLYDVAAS